jgi:NCAIR mutase (PurE)-related protein
MNEERIKKIIRDVRNGALSEEDALENLRHLSFEDMGFARIDHHRALRQGMPEVVFAQGKRPEQVAAILERLAAHNPLVIATRADRDDLEAVKKLLPEARCFPDARVIAVGEVPTPDPDAPYVLVVSAGTSDQPVAEEAAVVAELLGLRVQRLYDVGVAGIHRLLAYQDLLQGASVTIVVAGMEGALPSVVGGLVRSPVIAVPTSVGYGASFGGLAALLGMLNSCAPGIAVVNIDNGFGAAVMARRILDVGLARKPRRRGAATPRREEF